MIRSRWPILIVLLVIVAGGAWWLKSRSHPEAPRYRTAEVERGSIESRVSATGTIRPVVQVEVGSQVSGTVQRLDVDYNSRVKRGAELCQLEPSSFRARALQSEAAVARAEAALKDANRQFTRANELIKQNYISQADVDAAEVAVEQRQADLKQARAQLEAADVDLANTTIRAPIDGVVIARSIDVGQTVAASLQAPKLFVLANDLTQMQVETRIDEADIGQIHPDLPVTFTVDAFPDAEFQGRVEQVRLEPIVEQGVVTYTTVIHTRNPDLKLRPGMTANVSVLVDHRDDVLKVPNAALRFHPPMDMKQMKKGGAFAANAPGAGGPMARGGEGARAGGGAMPGGGSGAHVGGTPGGDSDQRQRVWAMVRSGKITPEQAWHMMGGGGAAGGGGPAAGGRARVGTLGGDGPVSGAVPEPPTYKPGAVYVMRGGKLARVTVLTGLSDGTTVEVRTDELKIGDALVVGLEVPATNGNLQPPPGMGGPQFRGPGGGRPGGGGGGGGGTRR